MTVLASQVGAQELYLWCGLGLLGYGCWQVSAPLGLIVPGAVLIWMSMPTRPPFFVPFAPQKRRGRTEDA